MKIKLKTTENEKYTLIYFELIKPIEPKDLLKIEFPKIDATKGVILSGRGPIWLYCYLMHHYHPTKFIATYDPRLNGAVIVESHTSEYRQGDLIKVDINKQ